VAFSGQRPLKDGKFWHAKVASTLPDWHQSALFSQSPSAQEKRVFHSVQYSTVACLREIRALQERARKSVKEQQMPRKTLMNALA
jgi:hypothetical protein